MPQRYPRLGEQITRLTRSLVAVKGWDKKYTMDYVGNQTGYSPDMVYRWQQGRSGPSLETIEMLAKIGKEEANLPREWGESLLNATRHPDTATFVNNLWGPQKLRFLDCIVRQKRGPKTGLGGGYQEPESSCPAEVEVTLESAVTVVGGLCRCADKEARFPPPLPT